MGLTEVRYSIFDLFFGDMRVSSLETLALMPIQDQLELGNSLPRLIAKLSATDFYPPLFTAAFDSPEITSEHIARALAQFLRSLISCNAKVDAYSNPRSSHFAVSCVRESDDSASAVCAGSAAPAFIDTRSGRAADKLISLNAILSPPAILCLTEDKRALAG